MHSIEQLTAFLVRAGINPSGYGERIGETREEHVERIIHAGDVAMLPHIIAMDMDENWPKIEESR